jgi:hypothetical protein
LAADTSCVLTHDFRRLDANRFGKWNYPTDAQLFQSKADPVSVGNGFNVGLICGSSATSGADL